MPRTSCDAPRRLDDQLAKLKSRDTAGGHTQSRRAAILDQTIALTEVDDDLEQAIGERSFAAIRHLAIEEPDVARPDPPDDRAGTA